MLRKVTCPRCWRHQHPFCDKCENDGTIHDVKLSRSFHLSEFTYSPTAQTRRIPNDATIRQQDRLTEFCKQLLQPIRDYLGPLFITSGLRSPELNALVKGSSDSAHLHAYAADCKPEEAKLEDMLYFLWNNAKIMFDQIILEHGSREDFTNDDWVHLGWKRASGIQRRQFLIMRNGIYTPWTP
jgi:hypothetical protein